MPNGQAIVLGGAGAKRGMVGYAEILNSEDSAAIHAYVIERARAGRKQ